MKLGFKTILILACLFIGSQAFAYTSDYKPAFLVKKNKQSLVDIKNDIKKDIAKLKSIVNKKEKIRGFVKTEKPVKNRIPASSKKSLPL